MLLPGPYGDYNPNPRAYGPDDPGGGPYDPETGLRDWYNPDPTDDDEPSGPTFKWSDLLENFASIESDFDDLGYDLESGILRDRTWRWFTARVSRFTQDPTSFTFRSAATLPAPPAL